ncbi:MAG: adenine phosphoribosyltransferase [Ignavibacteria bacterium]|nr:adenine phosphoribosyltransferase [Ignavibacteria bacterium]
MELEKFIRDVPDFPKKGIIFKDITTLLKDKTAFKEALNQLYDKVKNLQVDKVVAIEARGFIFGSLLAEKLDAGFVPVRKPGKLPAEKISESYQLEYGVDTLEIHSDAIQKGEKVLIHDDLLATGGTVEAVCKMIERLGGEIVGIIFLIELDFLNGREKLKKYPVHSIIHYGTE